LPQAWPDRISAAPPQRGQRSGRGSIRVPQSLFLPHPAFPYHETLLT
jgi:hypothetical protein